MIHIRDNQTHAKKQGLKIVFVVEIDTLQNGCSESLKIGDKIQNLEKIGQTRKGSRNALKSNPWKHNINYVCGLNVVKGIKFRLNGCKSLINKDVKISHYFGLGCKPRPLEV